MITERENLTETVLEGKPSDRPWEGCINSVVYRVQRGVPVMLPRHVAEHIAGTDAERKRAGEFARRLSACAAKL